MRGPAAMSDAKHNRVGNKRKRKAMNRKVYSPLTSSPSTCEAEVSKQFEVLESLRKDAGSASSLTAAHEAISYLSDMCMTSEVVHTWILDDEQRLELLLVWLDLDWYPLDGPDFPRIRDDCVSCVCQIVSHLAAQSDFRQLGSNKTQTAILAKLIRVLEAVPAEPTARECSTLQCTFRSACEAMTNVLREQKDAKRVIQELGGIPQLVRLLSSIDTKVQRASASVLRTLAFKEDAAKMAIVECDAVPPLIRMLRSEDHTTHYEAVGTLGNLVHSSPEIKRRVLEAGVLQPVINLLQCTCRESLREAALLVGQFAQCESRNAAQRRSSNKEAEDYRVKIVQRGAVPPLINMLKTNDRALREMAAFALGRLAQNADNQAGIFAMGVLQPLLDLLTSKVKNLEHNAAFTLYGLADNPDNVPEIVKRGGYERLRAADFPDDQPTKDCIVKTMKRIADKVQSTDFIKEHLMQLLSSKAEGMKERIAVCLAHLLTDGDLARAYSCYGGGEVLLDLVCSVDGALEVGEGGAPTEWENAVAALKVVVEHCGERESAASVSCGPPPPQNKVSVPGEYVNNPQRHDVVFLVEGAPFFAHKLALRDCSVPFDKMFEGGYREGQGGIPEIEIPNISRPVFEAMVAFVYTGDVDAALDGAMLPELLEAADQYMLDALTTTVAARMTRGLRADNVVAHFELARRYNATKLEHAAAAFIVRHHGEVEATLDEGRAQLARLLVHLKPVLREYMQACLWEVAPRAADSDKASVAASESR